MVALTVVQPVHDPLSVFAFGPERTWMVIVMPLGRSASRTSASHPTIAPASMTAKVKVVDAAYGGHAHPVQGEDGCRRREVGRDHPQGQAG